MLCCAGLPHMMCEASLRTACPAHCLREQMIPLVRSRRKQTAPEPLATSARRGMLVLMPRFRPPWNTEKIMRESSRRRKELKLEKSDHPKATTPTPQTDPPPKLTPEETRRKLEANPRFKKAGGEGEVFIIPGSKP